jgi:hypothetical protein
MKFRCMATFVCMQMLPEELQQSVTSWCKTPMVRVHGSQYEEMDAQSVSWPTRSCCMEVSNLSAKLSTQLTRPLSPCRITIKGSMARLLIYRIVSTASI